MKKTKRQHVVGEKRKTTRQRTAQDSKLGYRYVQA